jgi:undecaprenyl-diphosphatase
MTIFQSIILGIVQGATEFLPVSSSGHLILVPNLLNMPEQPLVFDTTMHLATALTLVVYFFKDYLILAKRFFTVLFTRHSLFPADKSELGLTLIFLASLPAAFLGFFLDDIIENVFRNVMHVILFMAVGTILMILAEIYGKRIKTKASLWNAIVIGFFQSLALLPGVSRSGATISGGMLLGLKRDYAARFSFLISVPIVLGAATFKIMSTDWSLLDISLIHLFLGFISSFITGMVAVKFLLNYLKNKDLKVFIIYRILLILIVSLTVL